MDREGRSSASEPKRASGTGSRAAQVSKPSTSDSRECLRGASPGEVLAGLVPGDPLGARVVVRIRLEERALLLDADRVYLRSLARCARYAAGLRRHAALGKWLVGHVDAAIDELLLSEGRVDPLPPDPAPSVLEQLASPLGLDLAQARAACTTFNHRTGPERRAFYDLCLRGISLDDAARAAGVSASEVARRARIALDAVLEATGHGEAPDGTDGIDAIRATPSIDEGRSGDVEAS